MLALAGVALYAIAGFWIAPRLLERKLHDVIREDTNLDLAIQAVAVNPFTLTLSLDNVTLFRPENTPVVSVERVEGRLGAISFGRQSLLVRDVVIRSLNVPDVAEQEPALTLPLLAARGFTLGPDLRSSSIDGARMERPILNLRRGPGESPGLAPVLGSFLLLLEAGSDAAIDDGTVVFTDLTLATPLRLEVGDIDGSIARQHAGSKIVGIASLAGRPAGAGTAELAAEWLPARPHEQTRLALNAHRLSLTAISPYVADVIGRAPLAGQLDLNIELAIDESMIDVDSDFVVSNLQLARAGRADGQGSSVDTVVALLENEDGVIAFRLPFAARWRDSGSGAAAAFSATLAGYLASLAASPFEYLGGLVGRPGIELGQLAFPPGSAEISGDTAEKIAALKLALEWRPKLGFNVFPALDRAADRAALAEQQVRLHVNLASSAGVPGGPASPAVDFDDPIVRSVLDEFTANRLPQSRQAALAEGMPGKDDSYYRAVFDALVDNEDVPMPALERLARYRARSVAEALSAPGETGRIRQEGEIVYAEPADSAGARVPLEARHHERR